jgi:hypothetical protein
MVGAHRILIEVISLVHHASFPEESRGESLMGGPRDMRLDFGEWNDWEWNDWEWNDWEWNDWEWNDHKFSRNLEEFGVWDISFCEWFYDEEFESREKAGCRF